MSARVAIAQGTQYSDKSTFGYCAIYDNKDLYIFIICYPTGLFIVRSGVSVLCKDVEVVNYINSKSRTLFSNWTFVLYNKYRIHEKYVNIIFTVKIV